MPRSLHRRNVRRLNRRRRRRITRGRHSIGRDFGDAMRAFARVVRARQRLVKLAPHRYDPDVINRENLRRAADAERHASFAAALEKVYGPGSGDRFYGDIRQREADAVPKLSRRIEQAVERYRAERELWLQIGNEAWTRFAERPHVWLSLSQIARLLDMASQLGRCATGMPLSTDCSKPKAPPPAEPNVSFEQALEKIYGRDTCESAGKAAS